MARALIGVEPLARETALRLLRGGVRFGELLCLLACLGRELAPSVALSTVIEVV